MIKKIIVIFLSIIFLLVKKIFIKENRIPNKKMDNFSNKLHSIFIFTSIPTLYLLWFDIKVNSFALNIPLYLFLFIQIVFIVRYFNPLMLIEKDRQIKILRRVNTFSVFLFIFNWIMLSFGFALLFLLILLLNNIFYRFIINLIRKQKEKEAFNQQFGEGGHSKDEIIKKHILNLFEENLDIKTLDKSLVKKQYRIMAKKHHPDVNDNTDKDKFTSINSSYNFLLDLLK